MARVGVLGAGSIGGSAAARFASQGVEVATFDIDAERVAALAADGVAAAANARELAEGAEVIFLALPNTPHIESALAGDDGLRAGLREFGYVEGQTFVLEFRFSSGQRLLTMLMSATRARAP